MTAKLLSLDDLRTTHENIRRRKEARKAQYEADKAAAEASLRAAEASFKSDIEKLDAEAVELEVAQRVWQRVAAEMAAQAQGMPKSKPNGHDPEATPPEDDDAEDDAPTTLAEPDIESYRTHKDMVLEAVRTIGGKGVMRHQIENYIKQTYKLAVPPPSISTYLKRLRDDRLVQNPGDGLSWYPAGGPAR